MLNIDEAWENFYDGDYDIKPVRQATVVTSEETPKSSPLYFNKNKDFIFKSSNKSKQGILGYSYNSLSTKNRCCKKTNEV